MHRIWDRGFINHVFLSISQVKQFTFYFIKKNCIQLHVFVQSGNNTMHEIIQIKVQGLQLMFTPKWKGEKCDLSYFDRDMIAGLGFSETKIFTNTSL